MAKEDRITYGAWTWDPVLLMSKIKPRAANECWGWAGAVSPHSNLMGAYKNGRAQMTQAARLIWQTIHQQDIGELEVRHTCGNRFCTNPQHMFTRPNHMRYHKTGELLGTRPQPVIEPQPPKLGEICRLTDREWWEI